MSKGQPQGQVIEKFIFTKLSKEHDCVILHFYVILTGRSFYVIMFVIQCYFRDHKVNLKVKCLNIYLYKCQQTSCVIPLFDLILTG